MVDSRTTRKRVEDWLNRNGWWLFSVGITVSIVLALIVPIIRGDDDPNALSISLTVLEIFIVVVAFGGFWMVRGAAIQAARGVAVDEVKRLVDEGYLVPPNKASAVVTTAGPQEKPDLSEAVLETGEDQEGDDNGDSCAPRSG